MASTAARDEDEEEESSFVREDVAVRDKAYLEEKGISSLIQGFFDDLFQREELPANPYPELVRRFRIAESAQGLFRSIHDDAKVAAGMLNNVATSPELSGVTYVQGSRGIWGMPHMLRMADVAHLEVMAAVVNENEQCLRVDAHELDDRHGDDCHVNVCVALTGPAALAGRLFRYKGMKGGERTVWTPVQLHDTADAFISYIKTSVPFRPSVTMSYLFLSPASAHRAVGGPIMSIQRSYTMHHRSSSKSSLSVTNRPFRSLYGGLFLSGAEAKHYGELFRMQGLSFAVEGVAGAKEYLAENVERAREVGDTLGVHSSLMPLALLSGVNDEGVSAGAQAVVDVSRVTKSAAARHRSRRTLCDHILLILGMLVGWVRGSQPILKWEGGGGVIYLDDGDSQDDESDGQWHPKTRCGSSKDLVQTWLRTTHQLFWGWRCDLLRYLDEDRHSDVVVVKDKARRWMEEISDAARMGLRLPMLRWHDHGRTIADGRSGFLKAAALARRRLSGVSAWLHCLDLSLSWDAAKVCDGVHARHLEEKRKKGDVAPQGGWSHLLGFQLASHGGHVRETGLSLPTTAGLLQLQRGWLDDAVAAAHVRDSEGTKESGGKRIVGRRKNRTAASPTPAAVEAALTSGVRYVPAPATPDSTRAPKAVKVRLAVVETLREDAVPEVFAHEITLMKYAADNRIDKSLHDSISEVLTSVLAPNPFPALTDSLALSSILHVFRRTVDSEEDAIQSGAPKLVAHAGEEGSQVFVAHGTRNGSARIYGSKPALEDVDVEGASSLFGVLPPIAGWVLDGLGDRWTDVDVGISGFARYHGSQAGHDAVPSYVTVMLACACSLDLDSGTTPMEYFTRCAVHCASAAHTNNSGLLVVGLTARTAPEDNLAAPPLEEAAALNAGQFFSLKQILDDPAEVEDELAHLHPGEMVLEAFMPFTIPTAAAKDFVLVPLSIRFVLLTSDHGEGGCSEALAAAMFYDCVYSTAKAAERAAARHSAVTNESGISVGINYVKRTRRLVLDRIDRREYLEAYRLVHHLRALRSVELPEEEDAQKSVPATPEPDIGGSSQNGEQHDECVTRNNAWKLPEDSVPPPDPDIEEAVASAIRHMLRGPSGRLDHARRLLGVLRRLVERENFAPEVIELLEEGELRKHAVYCTSYLLDTLAEQPPVRFEGAVESIKLRARLLLDRVAEMAGPGRVSKGATRAAAAGADATREAACDLAAAVTSMLDIVQLAAESDTHRCCPEMERAIKRYRAMDKRTEAVLPPLGSKGSGRRRAAAKAGGTSKKSAGIRRGSKK
ncbi:unnamed protein product [Ectocarpus sp. CCAP 1310/34]|nr:unnamed protein product [Ectocarpus sp. CCAP 1310/34]